jgi:hypothetical protein
VLVHVTVVPFLTVRAAGENAKFSIITCTTDDDRELPEVKLELLIPLLTLFDELIELILELELEVEFALDEVFDEAWELEEELMLELK